MRNNLRINWVLPFIIIPCFFSCIRNPDENNTAENSSEKRDTIIVKKEHPLTKSYEAGFLSKMFTYYWIVGHDTLDLFLSVRELVKDSTVSLRVYHEKPMLFASVLDKIDECYPLIKEDFRLSELKSFYFLSPIYYFDLVKEVMAEYEQEFGQRGISYDRLNRFLLKSGLNKKLDSFVSPHCKKVKWYGIEKFHLTDKESLRYYFPDVDLTDYPEFSIHGMGIFVKLEEEMK